MEREKAKSPGGPAEGGLVEQVTESKRQLLKLVLGGMAAYSTPLMASFSMEGLRVGSGGEALAQGFICNQTFDSPSASLVGADVEVSFGFIGGGGIDHPVVVEVQADVTAVYACRNRDGVFPPGQAPETVTDSVSASATFEDFPQIGALTLQPPDPTRRCPRGLEAVLVEVLYDSIVVSVSDLCGSQAIPAVPSSLSAVFFDI